jgi:hypothetical protein
MDHEKKEIEEQENQLEEESILGTPNTKTKKRKFHPFRWFLFLILIIVAALYIQQWYLDLEAEALVYARQTASAYPTMTVQEEEKVLQATETPTQVPPTATKLRIFVSIWFRNI